MKHRTWACLGLLGLLAFGAIAAGPPEPTYQVPPFRCVRVIRSVHKEYPNDLAISADGKLLLTTGDQGIAVWDVASGRRVAFRKFKDVVLSFAAFASAGKEVACTGEDNTIIRLMDVRALKSRKEFVPPGPRRDFLGLATPHDGSRVFAITRKDVGAWDARTGARAWLSGPTRNQPRRVAVSPSGKLLALAMETPACVVLLNPKDGKQVRVLEVPPALRIAGPGIQREVQALACSDNGFVAAALDRGATILLWGESEQPVVDIRWEGRWVTNWWPGRKGPEVRRSSADKVVFSPDGKTLAALCSDWTVRLFEVASGGVRAEWQLHWEAVAFSPDGKLLATLGSPPCELRVYDWRRTSRAATSLRAPDKSKWWAMLASRDAAVGFRAVCEMVAAPTDALALLEKNARVDADQAKRIAALVAKLDADNFDTRQNAEMALAKIGPPAESALTQALNGRPSLDLRLILQRLLAGLQSKPSEHLRQLRLVEVLEHLGTPRARRLLDKLAVASRDAARARERLRGWPR